MKAIAFAIICAAYLLVPTSEWMEQSNGAKDVMAFGFLISILGFWVCIIFESSK